MVFFSGLAGGRAGGRGIMPLPEGGIWSCLFFFAYFFVNLAVHLRDTADIFPYLLSKLFLVFQAFLSCSFFSNDLLRPS